MNLPEIAGSARIAPIVSSRKALRVISKHWKKKYDRKPDLVVVEGPLAGGHLGFSREDIDAYTTTKEKDYDDEVRSIIALADELETPVAVAGGVYERRDLDHCLAMGAKGVQMATRFVTTRECDASDAYKQAYIDAKKEDIVIVKSPVGMPGRAIRNPFLEHVQNEPEKIKRCFRCLEHCDPKTAPYCITQALIRAVEGDIENGLLFCGDNVQYLTGITTVPEVIRTLFPQA